LDRVAEILDGNAAEAFLKAWATKDRLAVQVLDAELERAVDLREMKPPVSKVLTHRGRSLL
jgi:hypothetical protein